MKTKKILVIDGHPRRNSLCALLAENYEKGAKSSGHQVKKIIIGKLKFDPILYDIDYGQMNEKDFEPDLKNAQKLIKWADHLVFVYPTWWGTYPALLKGFIDRVFLPKFAYKFKGFYLWDEYLAGKTAHLISTLGSPLTLGERIMFGGLTFVTPGERALKNSTLEFCGIKVKKVTYIARATKAKGERIEKLKKQMRKLGAVGK